jgi:PAS domain S-box-containing protein
MEPESVINDYKSSDDFFRTVFECVSIGICLMNLEGRIIRANPNMCRILGYNQEELQSHSCFDLTYPDDVINTREQLNQLLKGDLDNVSYKKRFIHKEGYPLWTSVGAFLKRDDKNSPQFFITHIKDISREKELETQLRHAQKTEAIATLAGGIAHDFNNILSSILGNAEFALRHELKDDDPGVYSVKQITKAAKRASFLVKQILTFSRRKKPELSQININPIVKEITKFLKTTLPTNIQTRLILKAGSDIVLADPVNVHQVLMNLCTNAIDAMQEEGGQLEIRLENISKLIEATPETSDSIATEYLKISISDTGSGITPEIKERIFEPYFTTKSREKGTGLGLPVVYGIMKDLNGDINFVSDPGKGTCFTINLPIHIPQPVAETKIFGNQEPVKGKRILFVDDDEQIVEFMERSFEALGYNITGKTDSLEALDIFKSAPDQFDVVISDMNMNGYTGDMLAKKVLETRPGIPVIICTGYDELLTKERAEQIGIKEIIMKPFMVDQLDESIRRIFAKEN